VETWPCGVVGDAPVSSAARKGRSRAMAARTPQQQPARGKVVSASPGALAYSGKTPAGGRGWGKNCRVGSVASPASVPGKLPQFGRGASSLPAGLRTS
jgi:hypothetical protein